MIALSYSKFVFGASVFMLASLSFAQAQVSDPVLMTVDGAPVLRSEFEAIYKKNNKDASVTREALDEYLTLFTNYKLKVRAAEALGMDTVQKFRNELDGYRKQLARPYLTDRDLNDALLREAYDRSQQEVRASHILVSVTPEASPEDTLAAWKRIMALRERIVGGADFATVAQEKGGSDDPSAAKNGGDLGYFSALQMVYPFESAAFATPVGELSQPVRTRFGYHIIKVTDKRPARGSMKAAHIMLRSTDQDSPERQSQVEKRVREIHAQVMDGRLTFEDAALKYSEDESTSTKGGELPVFSTGKMIEEFEDAAFALPSNGAVSEPVRSRFGWHIIKRLDYTPPTSFEAARNELKTKIARDSRSERTRQVFLDRLKKEYGYVAYPANLKKVTALLDTNVFRKGVAVNDTTLRRQFVEGAFTKDGLNYRRELVGAISGGRLIAARSRQYDEMAQTMDDTVVVREIFEGWRYDRRKAAKLTKPVFSFAGVTVSQQDLLDRLESAQRRERAMDLKAYVTDRMNAYADERILAHEDGQLEAKHADFRMLMKEYRDGILLFELTDQKVWGRAVRDTAGLLAFHEAHRNDFMWPTRYDADIYTCADAKVAAQLRTLLKKGKRGAQLTEVLNAKDPLALSIDNAYFTAEQKPFLAQLDKPGLSKDITVNGQVVVVDLKQVMPPAPKALEEARGAITAAYQDALESEWIAELRARYPVTVNKDVLYSIQ
ncbi:MAG: peptidylprolyl isomerase [Flavobacteriales bacterium]